MNTLEGVHPKLVEKVERMLKGMEAWGHPMLIVEGVRTAKRQAELYAQGRTKPGKIVTQLDGVTKKSNHQVKEDGFGYAVDLCFVVDGQPSWDDAHPWKVMGAMAQHLGLIWGGAWVRFVDRPHVELVRLKDPHA